jgi:hypothetical protein
MAKLFLEQSTIQETDEEHLRNTHDNRMDLNENAESSDEEEEH